MIRGARRIGATLVSSSLRKQNVAFSGIGSRDFWFLEPRISPCQRDGLRSWSVPRIGGLSHTLAPYNGMLLRYATQTATPEDSGEKKELTEEDKLAELFISSAESAVPSVEEVLSPEEARNAADSDEFRERFEGMMKLNRRLKRSVALMGVLQLVSGWYVVATEFKADTLYFFYTGLSATLSFQIAYLLHSAVRSAPRNIDKKLLTLPLWSVRCLANFLGRTNLIVVVSGTGLLGALAYEVAQKMS